MTEPNPATAAAKEIYKASLRTELGHVLHPDKVAAIITRHFAAQAAECELCGRGVEKPHIICGDCQGEYSQPAPEAAKSAAEIKVTNESTLAYVAGSRILELQEQLAAQAAEIAELKGRCNLDEQALTACECECSALQQRADAAERENKQLNQECRDRLKAELEAGNRLTAATRELEALRGAIERFRDAPMTERDAYDNLIAALHPARPESKAKPT